MQVMTGTDAKHPKEFAKGLSEVSSEVHMLRLQTRDLRRRLRGPMCKTLRVLLGQQQDELRHAEAELATRAREIRGPARRARWTSEASCFATSDGVTQSIDERIMCLVQAHETAARMARRARGFAEDAHDLRTCKLLARQTDVHENAAWTLASIYVVSMVSCELCVAKGTCPLSADDCH